MTALTHSALAAVAGSLLLAGCGEVSTGSPPAASSKGGGGEAELVTATTVLEQGDSGAMLCLGGVAESLPPQCTGPVVTNWDWTEVRGSDSRAGTTWGDYVVVGTYDGAAFTLTRPVRTREEYDGPPLPRPEESSLSTPCAEPPGGWRVLRPELTTQESLERTISDAQRLEGYADLWLDQSPNTGHPEAMNDPRKLVLNVRVTEDLAGAEHRLRETWGGALCVSRARRTAAELEAVQREVTAVEGVLTASSGRDVVEVGVIFDDGSLQQAMDRRYGAGVVRVRSALTPYRADSD